MATACDFDTKPKGPFRGRVSLLFFRSGTVDGVGAGNNPPESPQFSEKMRSRFGLIIDATTCGQLNFAFTTPLIALRHCCPIWSGVSSVTKR